MEYYAHINTTDNSIGVGQVPVSGDNIVCLEITEEVYNNIDHYIYDNGELILNPNYEEEQEEKRKARIMELTMTPLDFLKALETVGITYEMVKQIMEANPLVERELRFCSNVYRKHPMIEQFATQFGITTEQIDNMFIAANGGNI
jgi:hypothetical protein